jgi:hypothetical protein
MRGEEHHAVAMGLRLAAPVVAGAAGFHDDSGRRRGGDEAGELRAGEAMTSVDAAGAVEVPSSIR